MATQIGQLKYSVGFDVKKQDLNALKASLQQIKQLSLSDLMKINQSDRASALSTFTNIRRQAENVQKAIKDAFNVKLNTVNIESFNKSLQGSHTSIEQIYNTFKQAGTAGENAFRNLSSQVLTTNTQLKQTHKFLDNIATTLANTVKWNIASSAVNALSNSVQQAWGYVKNLDTSLNDIRVVTGKSADEMANFAVQANNAAQSLGKTTVDYTKAALIYAQQGLNDEEIAARAAITLKTANVTGQSTAQVSEELTSVWNGYKVNAEQAELYIDRLAAVAASTASDLEQLSTGMSKVAAAAAAMGVGEDQLAAQLSTIISVTRQAPESIGTALRTVYARISDIKAGLDEDGVTLGNYSSKMAELGFNVLDVNGKLRDMGQVIEDIGGRWQSLTREQQVSLAQTMAGQRQYSNLIALFDNFEEYNRALNIAQNAAGTLQKQQDIYMQSTAAHLNQLKAATENLYDSLLNPDSLEPLIDGLTSVLNLAAKFVDSIGGGGALLTSLGAIGVSVFSDQIAKGLNTTITNFEIAKRNAQQFDNVLQTIQQWKGIAGLDQTTKSLLENREQILSLSKLMTPEQFSGMQGLLNNITETGNKLATIKDQKGLFDSQLKEIGNIKEEWKDFNSILKDAEAQQGIKKNLQDQENEFTNAASQLREYGNSIRQVLGRQGTVTTDIENLKNNVGQYLSNLEKLATTNGSFKNHAEQISNLRKEFDNLNNIPESELPAKLSQITASIQGLYTNGANAAQGLREKLIEEFAETARSLGYSEKEIEDKLNKLVKAFQTARKEAERTAKIKSFTDLAGSLAKLGSSIKQIQNLGSIWKNEDLDKGEKILQTVTNLGMSLPMLISGAKQAGQALSAMFSVSAGLSGGIVAGLTVLVGIIATVVKGADEANQALIKLKQTEIDQQNKKQQQIQTNKKLYSSVEELNKQYKQGQITRIQLRSAVEDLIDQYGIEDTSIRTLAGDYDALTEAIKRKRIEAAREGQESAKNELQNAQDLILSTSRKGIGRKVNDNYNLYLGGGFTSDETFLGLLDEQSDVKVAKYLKNAGFGASGQSGYEINIDFSHQSILDLYEKVSDIAKKIKNDINISDADRSSSELYQNMLKWLNKMQPAVNSYKEALKDTQKYSNDLTILTSTGDLNNIQTANDYLKQRQRIIDSLIAKNKEYTKDQAADIADTYLRDNYRKLFNQFDQTGRYIQEVRKKLKKSDAEVEALIAQMDSQHLGMLIDIVNLDNIDDWDQLEEKIRQISEIDLSNVESVVGTEGVIGAKEAAADRYTFFQSLEDQVKSGKSISSKEIERISKQAPQLQSYFTMMANGQYKMTEDAQKFYNAVDSLKLSGFLDTIKSINEEIDKTKRLSEGNFNYVGLGEQAYSIGRTTGNQNRFLTDDDGHQVAEKIHQYIKIDEELVERQYEYLKTARQNDQEFQLHLEEWRQTLYNINEDLETRRKAAVALADAVNEQLSGQTYTLEELTQQAKRAEQALYDAINPTDSDISESALFGLTQVIKDLADDNNEFAESLDQDARAAQNVAQAILRFNNAIEDMVKNYDTWHGVLTNESVTIQQLAEVMQPLRDAYADLLDMDGSSLSTDFLQSAQNLQLMKAAIDGNIESYEQLRQLAAQDIIAHLKFDTEEARSDFMNEFSIISQWMSDHTAEFKIGASFDEQQYADLLGSLTNLINATQMTAAQASDLLHDAFGIDAEVIQQTKTEPVKHTITGYTANVADKAIPGTDPLTGMPVTYHIPSIKYNPQTLEIQDQVAATGIGLKIINAHKSSGGNIKWKHSAQGAGSAGVKRRTEAAEKAAKKTEVKPDTSTKETKNYKQDDRDIYHDINLQLDEITRQLNRVQKVQERLFGKQLIDNLNKQSQILEQHKAKLKEKQKLQQLDLAQKAEQLKLLGVIVNTQTGNIDNYLDALGQRQGAVNGLIAQYNSIVGSYNATTDKQAKDVIKDQLTEVERALKDAETDYKNLESKIKNYDDLRKAYEDIADAIEEQTQKQIEINITKFKMAVEIRLDMGEAQRDWNKFRREVLEGSNVLKDTDFETLLKNANQNYNDVYSYFDIHGNNRGQIASLTDQVNDTLDEIIKIQNKEESVYGDNMAQAMEDLANYSSKLQDSMINVRELINDIDQAYLNMYDDISDQMDKQIDDYQFLNDLIQHDMDLLQLLYGDEQYDAMNSYYTEQHNNQLNQIDFLRQSVALVKERWQLEEAAGNTNAAEKLKEQYKKLVSDLNSLVEQSVKTLQDKYTNAINQIFDALDKRVTNGLGTDYLQMQWELINKNADEYLDTINSAFALQELETKFQNAINDNKNVKNQKVLTDLMNEQLNQLRAKDKLTQYDVDRAEKLLQIEQARMALEDTRSAKTSLRLKRDSQGNYSYVYSANEEDVQAAEDNLAKLQNDLYNFDKDAYRKNLDDMLSAWKDFQSKYKEIVLDTSLTEEERVERLALLRDQYGEYINNKIAENEVIRTNLMASAFMDYAQLYEGDQAAYLSMIDSEKNALMTELVPQWNSGIQQMVDAFRGAGGFIPACEEGFNELDAATVEYERELETLQQVADVNFAELREGALDPTAESFKELIAQNDELINQMRDQINDIQNLKNALNDLIAKYQAVWDAANNAAQRAHDALQDWRDAAAAQAEAADNSMPKTIEPDPVSLPSTSQPTTVSAVSGGGGSGIQNTSGGTPAESQKKNPWLQGSGITTTMKGIAGNIYYNGTWKGKDLQASLSKMTDGNTKSIEVLKKGIELLLYGNNEYYGHYKPPLSIGDEQYFKQNFDYYEMIKKLRGGVGTSKQSGTEFLNLDTGGYTGEWGSEGRLAMLHQKELVLNAQDTKNMLDSVEVLRSIVANLGGNISAKLNGLNGGYAGATPSQTSSQVDQNVSIQANFPNVNSKREIEEAFSELVNLAAQRAMRRT